MPEASYPTVPLSTEATDPLPSATPPATVTLVSLPMATAFFTLVAVPFAEEPMTILPSAPVNVLLSPKTTAPLVLVTLFSEPMTETCCTLEALFL